MATRIIDITRRRLLRGAAGFSLALPFLPSLAERTALGDPVYTRPRRLFWFATDHGGAFENNMFPDVATLTTRQEYLPGHTIGSGPLAGTPDGDRVVVSPILSGKATSLTPSMVGKMNVLRGLDCPFFILHNTGLHLGNYAANISTAGDGFEAQKSPRPTIDQLLAWSPSFYRDVSTIRQRSMIMSSGRELSSNWSDPSHRSGTIQNVRGIDSSRDLFNSIFVPADAGKPQRPPIVDRILESYKTLRDGNRRLSSSDKQRLSDHIDRLNELERRLNVKASCGNVMVPTDDAKSHQKIDATDAVTHWRLFCDVVVAAFLCGTSRIAVAGVGSTEKFVGFQGDWHPDVAHQWQLPDKQKLLSDSYQHFFEGVFLDAAHKLDIEEAPGVSYLDNTLMAWSQESCMATHSSISVPIVTMGSAGGYFKTGIYADYRNVVDSKARWDPGAGHTMWLGILYNQWLANVLLSMGLAPADFELWGHKGYGLPLVTRETYPPLLLQHYQGASSSYFQMASTPLPFLT